MVKKVGGPTSPRTPGASAVEPTKPVQPQQVGTIDKVQSPDKQVRKGRVRRPTRPMTAEEREHLFQLIREEADKMFGPNGLPESQRNTVEGAVRKTISASAVDKEENGEGSK